MAYIAIAIAAAAGPARAAAGLVAGYSLNEGVGTTAGDASGNGLNGTLIGSPAWVAGKNASGLAFNGSSNYVDLTNPAALRLTGSMTLSAWVKEASNVVDDGQIIAKSDGASGWQFKSTPDTGVRTFGIAISSGGAAIQRYSRTVRALGTWYFVAGVYDAAARTLDIYVNGVLDNGVLSGTVPASQSDSPVNANLGRRTGGFTINGTVDDVRVYARALTAAEIQADMAAPIGGGDTTAPSVPQNLTAAAASSSQINLSWIASTDNVGVAGYRIYRNGAQVGTSATASFADTGLAASTAYTYSVAAYDLAGNASAQSAIASATTADAAFNFTLANGGVRSVAQGGSVTNTATATLSAGAAQAVTFSASGLPAGATASFSPGSCAPTCTTTITLRAAASTPIGNSTITVTAAGGSVTRMTTFTLTTVSATGDTTPPTVALTAPTAGASVGGTAVTVGATATDNVGVAAVQFQLDGANLGAQDSTSPYSITWNTTSAANGAHTLTAIARDAAGNTRTSAPVSVVVDNTAPTGAVVINGGAAATNSSSATLMLSATDALSAITQMRFSNTGTSYSAAEAYATTKAWTLSSGAGTKTVYVQFKDAAGNWSSAATDTIVLDTTAPTIAAVAATNVTASSATISWTTNEAATSRVEYGTTTSYGSRTPLDPTLLSSHAVSLTGLAPQVTYNYRVRSSDAAGNERIGSNGTFTTTGVDNAPPSTPASLSAVAVSPTQINLGWTASTDNVGVTGYAIFRDGVQVGTSTTPSFADAGLHRNTSYSYTVTARDAAGNVSALSAPASATTPPFQITAVASSNVTATGATIGWTTDQPATSQVEYGTTTGYGTLSPLATALVTAHSATLTGLPSNTTFHYRVRSMDITGNTVVSGDNLFTTQPAGIFGVFQNEILVSGLPLPTAVKFLPNGDMLAILLGGTVRRVRTADWTVDPAPFLTLTNIGTLNGQQGLMDLVLDPDFSNNRYYYVFYTLGSPNRDRCSRFTATADLTATVPGSELVIYQDPLDANVEHHGGALNFGNDGKLYITTGEHFNAGDAQLLTSPRGKILRYNADGTIPTDNPFYDGSGPNVDAIWALGLRNPYRASYDRLTGRLIIGDVGGNDYSTAQEEANLGVRGANYGWPNCEGFSCSGTPAYTSPIYSYAHNGRDAAITGGFVYRGTQFPAEYQGSYFFADYAQNWIKRLTFDGNGNSAGVFPFVPSDGTPDGPWGDIVYLTEGPDGALYYVDLGYSDTTGETGVSKIRRVRFVASNQPPAAVGTAQPTQGPAPLSVSFSSAGSYDPEGQLLSYLWDFGDGATSTEADPFHIYLARGPYNARVSVSDGFSTSLSPPITISVGTPPAPTISAPLDNATFRAGDVIAFSGDATDAEDGSLAASAFTWSIDFLHEGHVHPALPVTGVKSGTFTIPTDGHDFSGFTRYRITLTVTDSDGLQSSSAVIIYPQKQNLTFDTAPSGLQITLDGIPHPTPFVYDTLIGFHHTIEAKDQSDPQSVYAFSAWSDGGARQHVITVPAAAASYTATYAVQQNPLPSGLLAGYRFSEGSGTTTADLSPNGFAGTLAAGASWTTGRYGGGLALDGKGYVDLGNPGLLQFTGSMTLTSWIYITSNPVDDGTIVGKIGGAGWQLKTTPDTGPRRAAVQITSNGSDAIQRYGATTLQPNTWYHLAGVYDASARTLSVYVNGALDNGSLAGTVPASQANVTVNVQIGQRAGSPELFNFIGTIDEVHLFGRALSSAEIQTDMSTPR